MPNWCENNMTVTGPTDELDRFFKPFADHSQDESVDSENFNFVEHYVPMPAALAGTVSPTPNSPEPHPNWANMVAEGTMNQERYDELCADQRKRYEMGQKSLAETGYGNWCDWQAANWSIKWGASEVSHFWEAGDTSGHLIFDTPWGPAENAHATISAMFPELTFVLVYHEPGMGFAGAMRWKNGNREWCREISTDVDNIDWENDTEGEMYDALVEKQQDMVAALYMEALNA
jgi:hypothetical protein